MLNQLNTTTKRELEERFTALSNRVNTYLDTEQKVGKFGDDDLYQVTIDCGLLWNSQTKTITTDIVVDKIILIDGVAISTTNIINLPHVGSGSGDGHVALNINKDTNNKISIAISSNSDRTSYHGYVNIQYTKPTQP